MNLAPAQKARRQAMKGAKGRSAEDCGIGIAFEVGRRDFLVARALVDGGSADRSAVIHVGDMLVAVDGVPVRGFGVQEVANLLLGAEGSPVEVSFQRQTTVFTTTLQRRPSPKLASNSARDAAKAKRVSIEDEVEDVSSHGLLVEIQSLRSELAGHRTATSEAIASIRTHLAELTHALENANIGIIVPQGRSLGESVSPGPSLATTHRHTPLPSRQTTKGQAERVERGKTEELGPKLAVVRAEQSSTTGRGQHHPPPGLSRDQKRPPPPPPPQAPSSAARTESSGTEGEEMAMPAVEEREREREGELGALGMESLCSHASFTSERSFYL